jgi:hypothetical protein
MFFLGEMKIRGGEGEEVIKRGYCYIAKKKKKKKLLNK